MSQLGSGSASASAQLGHIAAAPVSARLSRQEMVFFQRAIYWQKLFLTGTFDSAMINR